jgi:hypothetical protein
VFLAIDARGIDLAIQSRPNAAGRRQEAQKAAELGDPMLQGPAAEAVADLADEGLHVGGGERGQSLRPDLVVKGREKLRHRGDVLVDGRGHEATEIVERDAIAGGQHGDPRDRRRPRRKERPLLREAEQAADGGARVGISRTIPRQACVEIGRPDALPLSMPASPKITIDSDQRPRVCRPGAAAIFLLA